MSHPEELELLEHGRTGWNRFAGVDHGVCAFDLGNVWRGVKPLPKRKLFDLTETFDRGDAE